MLAGGVFGADYRRLLGCARIAFNHAIRGECNLRAFEAAAAGALLFQEEGNRELAAYFRDGEECVCYDAKNLTALLAYYLEHEDRRRALAEAARARVADYTFARLWAHQLEQIASELPALRERARARPVPSRVEALRARAWEVLGASQGDDPLLWQEIQAVVAHQPRAALCNALGVVAGLDLGRGAGPAEAALAQFQAALACDPDDVLAGLNAAALPRTTTARP